jgi:hypothetical protein
MSRKTSKTVSRSVVEGLEGRRFFSASPMNFDLNRDGEINGDDFYVVDSNAGQEVSGWANGDVNGDGLCDGVDQAHMTAAFDAANAGLDTVLNDGEENPLVMLPGDANGDGSVTDADLYDLNGDGVVDDYEQWEASNGVNPRSGTWATGDFTGDGIVDENDVIIHEAVKDVNPDTGDVIDGDEWFEIDSRLLQDSVIGFF